MRWWGFLACVAVVVGVAACSLRPTGITDGDGPVARVSSTGTYVFFYVHETLRPLPRNRTFAPDTPFSVGPPVPTAGVDDDPRSRAIWWLLESLREGPTAAERSAGVSTAFPEQVMFAFLSVTDDAVLVGVGLKSPELAEPALTQLSCTLTSMMSGAGRWWTGTVTVAKGPGDARRTVPPCDIRILEALPYST